MNRYFSRLINKLKIFVAFRGEIFAQDMIKARAFLEYALRLRADLSREASGCHWWARARGGKIEIWISDQ